MNGYVTGTASITAATSSSACRPRAIGVFPDLVVLAAARCAARRARRRFAAAPRRSTGSSHLLLDTVYAESPFAMQRVDEPKLLAAAPHLLDGDQAAMATLVHVLTLGGLGVVVTGTSHSGSMGEHGISHYIDMFARPHPGSLHGAQVGVATLTMARLQELLLADEAPPVLRPSLIDDAALAGRYGAQAAACRKALEAKALTGERLAAANARLADSWADWRRRLAALAIPVVRLEAALGAIDAARTGADLGLAPAAYRTAVAHDEIRDRFGFRPRRAGRPGLANGKARVGRHDHRLVLGAGRRGGAFRPAVMCRPPLADGTHLDVVDRRPARDGVQAAEKRRCRAVETFHHHELALALDDSVELVVLGVSSAGIAWAIDRLRPLLSAKRPVLLLTKGLAADGRRIGILPEPVEAALGCPTGAVGGPCIAGELAVRRATSVVMSFADPALIRQVLALTAAPYYHARASADLVGTEVCAAFKNFMALGIGAAQGMADVAEPAVNGAAMHNPAAGLFTQAVLELGRLNAVLGGTAESVHGLAGTGDLYVTVQGGRNTW